MIEKRKHRRINASILFKMKTKQLSLISETINVSCTGMFCQLDRYIPLHTEVEITLSLPSKNKHKNFEYISCHGKVVRVQLVLSEKNNKTLFNNGIFLHEIKMFEREILDAYIKDLDANIS
ncbi:MAG: PilZ domain-containing protein [Candidatus Brocadiaceae bacterium]|nr:PilZ domain-containing protein [Candidatus Brocadiaceae bacterium]